MNNTNAQSPISKKASKRTLDIVHQSLAKRYRVERNFKLYGLTAIILSLGFLALLFSNIIEKGYTAFQQTFIQLEVFFDPQILQQEALAKADYAGIVKNSLRRMFPDAKSRSEKRRLYGLISSGASYQLRDMVLKHPEIIGKMLPVWVPADDDIDMLIKGHIKREEPEGEGRLNKQQLQWVDDLSANGKIKKQFNWVFFSVADSREPEQAGIWGAVVGSFLTLMITLLLSFPIGVAAAVYLEEFAPKNRWTDLIEININNLAGVPSIVFGLLGLAVFLNTFGLPRSAPFGRRSGADPDDPADHHYRRRFSAQSGTAFDSRSGIGGRRLPNANGFPPCIAAGPARDVDRRHYRHGPCARRNRAFADDRDGSLYCRHTGRVYRSGHGLAGSNLSVGQ